MIQQRHDFTIHHGVSHLDMWSKDDGQRRNWRKAHSLYTTIRDLPISTPYLYTLDQVMDAQRRAWQNSFVEPGDVLWNNAEIASGITWTRTLSGEWAWYGQIMQAAEARLGLTTKFQLFYTFDQIYSDIARMTGSTTAIVPLYPNRWYDGVLMRLKDTSAPHRIALIGPTLTAKATLPRILNDIESIPGDVDIGIWAGPDVTIQAREHINVFAQKIDEFMAQRTYIIPRPGDTNA